MYFKLSDVVPNPSRNFQRNPLQEAKVETLIESINATDFWKNVEGRVVNGKLQIAYGHHRVEALRRKYKDEPDKEFDFCVSDLNDGQMLQRMSRENNETYSSDLGSVIESVAAAVELLAEGRITLEKLPENTKQSTIRYAPSFVAGVRGTDHPYTTLSLARFLGHTKKTSKGVDPEPRIVAALNVLELEELGLWDKKHITLEKFRREKQGGQPGVIPVDAVLKATKDIQLRAQVAVEAAQRDHKTTELRAETTKVLLERAQAEVKRQLDERARLVAEHLAATRKEEEEKTEEIKRQQEETKLKQKAAEAKRKAAEKEWKANEAARVASRAALEEARRKAVASAEANRAGYVKTAIYKVDLILSVADPLHETLKSLRIKGCMSDAERKTLSMALRDVSN